MAETTTKKRYALAFVPDSRDFTAVEWRREQVRANVLRASDRFPVPVTSLEVTDDSGGLLRQPQPASHGWRILSASFEVDLEKLGSLSEDRCVFEVTFEAEIDPSRTTGLLTGSLGVPGADEALGASIGKRKVRETAELEVEVPPPYIDHPFLATGSDQPLAIDSGAAGPVSTRAVVREFAGSAADHFRDTARRLEPTYEEIGAESLRADLVDASWEGGQLRLRTQRAVLGAADRFFTGSVRFECLDEEGQPPRNQATTVPLEIRPAGSATVEVRITFPEQTPEGEPWVETVGVSVDGEILELALAGMRSDFEGTIEWRIADGPARLREEGAGFVTEWTPGTASWNETERAHELSLSLHPQPVGPPVRNHVLVQAPEYEAYEVRVEKVGFRPRSVTITSDHPQHAALHQSLRSGAGRVDLEITTELESTHSGPSLPTTPVADALATLSWSGGGQMDEQRTGNDGRASLTGPSQGGGSAGAPLELELELDASLVTSLRGLEMPLTELGQRCRASGLPQAGSVAQAVEALYEPFFGDYLRQVCEADEADLEKNWQERLVALQQIKTLTTYNKIFLPIFVSFRRLAEEAFANAVNWLVTLVVDAVMFGVSVGKGTQVTEIGDDIVKQLDEAKGLVREATEEGAKVADDIARRRLMKQQLDEAVPEEAAARRHMEALADEMDTVGKKLQDASERARAAGEAIEVAQREIAELTGRKEALEELAEAAEKRVTDARDALVDARIAATTAERSHDAAKEGLGGLRGQAERLAREADVADNAVARAVARVDAAPAGSPQLRVALEDLQRAQTAARTTRSQAREAAGAVTNAETKVAELASELAGKRQAVEAAEATRETLQGKAREARRQVLEAQRQIQEQGNVVTRNERVREIAQTDVNAYDATLKGHRDELAKQKVAAEEAKTLAEQARGALEELPGEPDLLRRQADLEKQLEDARKTAAKWEKTHERMQGGVEELAEDYGDRARRSPDNFPSDPPGWLERLKQGVVGFFSWVGSTRLAQGVATVVSWMWDLLKRCLVAVMGWVFRFLGRFVKVSDVLVTSFGEELSKQSALGVEHLVGAVGGAAGELQRHVGSHAYRAFDPVSGAIRGSQAMNTPVYGKADSTARKQALASGAMERARGQTEQIVDRYLRNVQLSMGAAFDCARKQVVTTDAESSARNLGNFTRLMTAAWREEEDAAVRASTFWGHESFNNWGTWLDFINTIDWFLWVLAWALRAVGLAISLTGVGWIAGATMFLMSDVIDVVKDAALFLAAMLGDYVPKGRLFIMSESLPVAAFAACFGGYTNLPDPEWVARARYQDLPAAMDRVGVPSKNL